MYNIDCQSIKSKYEIEELVKLFLKPDEYRLWDSAELEKYGMSGIGSGMIPIQAEGSNENHLIKVPAHITDKDEVKRFLYDILSAETSLHPKWGVLTGVRPVKLTMEQLDSGLSAEQVRELLSRKYYVSAEKIDLLLKICQVQKAVLGEPEEKSVGIYVGIPFCPTRCVYCSFPSNQAPDEKIAEYLEALHREILFTAERMREKGQFAESIYVGGGTPTTLNADQLDKLLSLILQCFGNAKTREITVEAGRPDTITEEKLSVIHKLGIERISINPQSMKEKTLRLIGRNHTPEQIVKAYEMALKTGIPIVNMDVIAGLPEESPEDFQNTLASISELSPANITVHTLALKRASRLKEIDDQFHYKQGQTVSAMLEIAAGQMKKDGYRPYYLYRQKQMSGNFENVGYALKGTENIYNIRIMEERQSIIAMGAGGISKACFPAENRLERIPNVSNYEIYIERLAEMLDRKDKGGIFK